jgi:DNA-nicking Smr family endonuclease
MEKDFARIFEEWEKSNKIINKDENIYENNDYNAFQSRKKNKELTIDLHYLKKNEALDKLKNFINNNRSSFLTKIIIIHGAGNHSKERCVLKDAVINWLKENPAIIKTFRPGRIGEGSFGVTVAYINPK